MESPRIPMYVQIVPRKYGKPWSPSDSEWDAGARWVGHRALLLPLAVPAEDCDLGPFGICGNMKKYKKYEETPSLLHLHFQCEPLTKRAKKFRGKVYTKLRIQNVSQLIFICQSDKKERNTTRKTRSLTHSLTSKKSCNRSMHLRISGFLLFSCKEFFLSPLFFACILVPTFA